MKIAIIGGGYTGLAASYFLSKKGVEVTLFESTKTLGGLASGFKDKNWKWSLEKYYHHLFASDKEIIKLADEIGGCQLDFTKLKSSIFYKGRILPFDSAIDLIIFPYIPFVERLRTGMMLLFLKFLTNWKPLEKITAAKFIKKFSGEKSWKVIWQPLFMAKFDQEAEKIPASWFWARIKKRGRSFRYPHGGFEVLTKAITKEAKKRNAKFLLNREIKTIVSKDNKISIKTADKTYFGFDKVICTLPGETFVKLVPNLPKAYVNKLTSLKGRGTIDLVLSLKKKLLTDGTYWLNINDKKFPFIGVIEQTNYISKNKYNNDNVIYLAKYLPVQNPLFSYDKKSLVKKFSPYLKKINPEFNENWIKKSWLFKSVFAQPIMTVNYSKKIPSFTTPITNVYLANMQQVYPWDRQTNYAVELGRKISEVAVKSS